MQAVILAGGLGTRISEETSVRPKPMVEIGGKPLLWHIMKIYSAYHIRDFIICLGYKGYMIKEYFANYFLHTSDVTFNLTDNTVQIHQNSSEPWTVTLVDTGENTMTGGRIKRLTPYLHDDFCLTYGDGLANINISQLIEFHQRMGKLATITVTHPPRRFGVLSLHENNAMVADFKEKPVASNQWINGGFFVLSPKVLDYIAGDTTTWEKEPLERLAAEGQLASYQHTDFWQAMDTLRDRNYLEELWATGQAPWQVW